MRNVDVCPDGCPLFSTPASGGDETFPEPLFPGLHWHQYLGSVLQIMGVPAREYARGVYGGYGDEFVAPAARETGQYPEATFRARGDMLPFLT